MGASLDGVDVIDVGMEVLGVGGVVHDGALDGDALLLGVEVDDIVEEVGAGGVDVAHELLEAVLGVEDILTRRPLSVSPRGGEGVVGT